MNREEIIFFLEDIILDYKITNDYESLNELSLKTLLDLFENNDENKLLDLIRDKLEELRKEKTND